MFLDQLSDEIFQIRSKPDSVIQIPIAVLQLKLAARFRDGRLALILARIRPILGALIILAPQICSANAHCGSSAQQSTSKSHRVVSRETYSRVLDILFPREDPNPSETIFQFILRFRPSFQLTSQIVIRRRLDKVQVVEYSSMDGNVYSKLNEALARGSKEDAVELAKLIRVQRKEISVPHAEIKRWYTSFFDSLNSTTTTLQQRGEEFDKKGGSESILLDGTIYDLWYEQRLTSLSFNLYGVEIDSPGGDGDFKLVQWMNSIRRDVQKRK